MSILENIDRVIKKRGLEEFHADIVSELENKIDGVVKNTLTKYKNKKRVLKNDNKKEHLSALEALSQDEIKELPSWVEQDIKNAVVIGKSRNVIQVSDGRKYHIKNKLNDLSGGEWTFFLSSVINTRYPTTGKESYAHNIRKIHPTPKPPQLMEQIIKFFTKENEIVFDYFMGVGGSLLGASLCNRRAVGIDLAQQYIAAYKEANKALELSEQPTIADDSVHLLRNTQKVSAILNGEKVSLILIDPPYGDMMSRPKTGEAVKKNGDISPTPFTDYLTDIGNYKWAKFRAIFKESVSNAAKVLKAKGHIVIFIKDLQPTKSALNLLHADLIDDISSIEGINYLGTKIWADQGVNLYPYGYPYSFVSNQIHQYILIFRKG